MAKESARSSPSSTSTSLQLVNANSTRIAWILAILLTCTLCLQITLLFYHDDFMMQMNVMEHKLMNEIAAVEDMAESAIHAVRDEDNDEDGGGDGGESSTSSAAAAAAARSYQQRLAIDVDSMSYAKWDESDAEKYSMEPEDILQRAGVDPSEGYMPQLSYKQSRMNERKGITVEKKTAVLPSLEEIQSMYGSKSHVIGLERCEEYRNAVPHIDRLMGPAGLFNSATNLLATLLRMNCFNADRIKSRKFKELYPSGVMPQAPWGKHNPAAWRNHHSARMFKKMFHHTNFLQNDFLPVVIIKDPITWMASMCRHGYETRWWRVPQHCPNLVPNRYDKRGGYSVIGEGEIAVRVRFATPYIGYEPEPDNKNRTFVNYTSMVDLWNTWYGQWYDMEFPRLMVRFEDLLFHAEETITKVCECGGGKMQKKFRYMEAPAKGTTGVHSGSAGFLASLVNYGNSTLRMKDIMKWEKDSEYFNEHVDKDLMKLFEYSYL